LSDGTCGPVCGNGHGGRVPRRPTTEDGDREGGEGSSSAQSGTKRSRTPNGADLRLARNRVGHRHGRSDARVHEAAQGTGGPRRSVGASGPRKALACDPDGRPGRGSKGRGREGRRGARDRPRRFFVEGRWRRRWGSDEPRSRAVLGGNWSGAARTRRTRSRWCFSDHGVEKSEHGRPSLRPAGPVRTAAAPAPTAARRAHPEGVTLGTGPGWLSGAKPAHRTRAWMARNRRGGGDRW